MRHIRPGADPAGSGDSGSPGAPNDPSRHGGAVAGAPPWFRERPAWAAAVAGAFFALVFTLRLLIGTTEDAVNLLYALPVALVALSFGRRAGLGAGVLAVGLVAVWTVVDDVELSALGWASRVIPLLLLGGLVGDASDRLAAAEARHRALEAAAERHRSATEVNDTLVQGMAAAKWALEAGRTESGLRTLTETLDLGHQLVSKLLRDADMAPGGAHRGRHLTRHPVD